MFSIYVTVVGEARKSWFEDFTLEQLKLKKTVNKQGWGVLDSPVSTPRISQLLELDVKGIFVTFRQLTSANLLFLFKSTTNSILALHSERKQVIRFFL